MIRSVYYRPMPISCSYPFLKETKEKIILIKGGHIDASLGELVDNKINAQDIKKYIAVKKQKPDSRESGLAES